MRKHDNRKNKIKIICKTCKKIFIVYSSSKRKYCSRRCYHKDQKIILKGRKITWKNKISKSLTGHKNYNSGKTWFKKGSHPSPKTEFTSEKLIKLWKTKKWRDKIIPKLKIGVKRAWSNKKIRDKMVKSIMKGINITPNKPEKLLIKLLNKILPKEYKFVGDGQIILGGFNPDFINCNGQKKIIEHFGTYWHSKTQVRDIQRIGTYKSLGYKTLVIWEYELQNIKKLKDRILKFNYEK